MGKTAAEIIAYVKDHLIEAAKNFHCADVLGARICEKLAELAAKIKVNFHEVERFMKEIIAKGVTKITEIIQEIRKHFFPSLEAMFLEEVNDITCEDILAEKVCASLKAAAKTFKLEFELIDELVRKAVEAKLKTAAEIIAYVKDHLIEAAKNFHCADVLGARICEKLAELAAKIKVNFHEVERFMKEIIAKGVTKITEIIQEIRKHFFPSLEAMFLEEEIENELKCEEVLSADVCKKLRDAAKKLKLKVGEINKLIKEAMEKGKEKAKEIIDYVHKRMVDLSNI